MVVHFLFVSVILLACPCVNTFYKVRSAKRVVVVPRIVVFCFFSFLLTFFFMHRQEIWRDSCGGRRPPCLEGKAILLSSPLSSES